MSNDLDLLTGPPLPVPGQVYVADASGKLQCVGQADKPGQIWVTDATGVRPTQQIDLLAGLPVDRISLYSGLGFVELLDMMPRQVPLGHTADIAIARAAWVSFARHINPETGDVQPGEVERITRYLREHRHTSPSEMVVFTFRARVPIFVFQHWVRHRTQSMNAESGRYIEMPSDFYLPELRMQSRDNKQGSSDAPVPAEAHALWNECRADTQAMFAKYRRLLDLGVSREVARTVLPLGLMTSFVWKMDLHNLVHLLRLRLDSHAQQETREFASAVLRLISSLVPASMRAFEDFELNTVTLDAEELQHLRTGAAMRDRKKSELMGKLQKIHIQPHQ